MEPSTNNIFGIHQKPLKYILINHKSAIEFIKDSGALSIYDNGLGEIREDYPTNDTYNIVHGYRELYAGNMFIAGGYGAQSRKEQVKLSNIAEQYDSDYNKLNTDIINNYNYAKSNIDNIYKTKVDWISESDVQKSNYIDTYHYKSVDTTDISLNKFDFLNNGQLIPLYELKNYLHFNVLQDLVITEIKYQIKLKDDPTLYDNYSYVPIDSQLEQFIITIQGNTNDSGGINGLSIKYNHDNPIDDTHSTNIHDYIVEINENNINETSIPKSNHQNISIQIIRVYDNSLNNVPPFTILEGENYLLSEIKIKVTETDREQYSNYITEEDQYIVEHNIIYPETSVILYGKPSLLYYENNSSSEEPTNDKYFKKLILDESNSNNIGLTNFNINENNQTDIDTIYIKFPQKFGTLISINYYDFINHSITNILPFFNIESTEDNYWKYTLSCKYDDSDELYQHNLPFISNSGSKQDPQYYFNKGLLKIECIKDITNNNIDRINSNIWISARNITDKDNEGNELVDLQNFLII